MTLPTPRLSVRFAGVAVLCAILGACASDGDAPETQRTALSGPQPVAYSARTEGLDDLPELKQLAEGSARTFRLAATGAPSVAGLNRRAKQDIEAMRRVLRAEGYYNARLDPVIAPGPDGAQQVRFVIDPGQQFVFGAREMLLDPQPADGPGLDALREASGLKPGDAARGEAVVAAEEAVVAWLKQSGFPDASFRERKAVARKPEAELDLTSVFDPGERALFGELVIEGESSLDNDYVRGLVPWKPNEQWDQRKIDRFQSSLKSTGLFGTVAVKPGKPDAAGVRPVVLQVENARQRSIGGSLRYDSDQGPGVRVFWRHRNLLGRAEDFRAEADVSLREQKLSIGQTRPRYPRPRWTTSDGLVLRRLDEDAFDELSATLTTGMELRAGGRWVLGGGLDLSAALITTDFGDDTSYLAGLPLYARRDKTNDPLDATRGYRLLLNAGPYVGLNNGDPIQFGVVGAGGSVYLPVIGTNRLVLALRSQVTSVLSQDLNDVPVNQRLFAGGGASVRGYAFQSISPANNQGDLTGGAFLNENSVELRLRLGESFGVVAFTDAGLVEEEPFPSFAEKLQVGVGGGFRYYSPIGPLRFDIAFPLDRRAGDSLFEFYISLGQAF